MKILCTADWHIGKKLEAFSRLEEQKINLDQLVSIAESENISAVIVAGDCFDNQTPSPEMTKLFVSTLAKLSRGGECPVFVIAGNHDNPLFLSASESFASQVGVVILGFPTQIPSLEQNHPAWKVILTSAGLVEIFFKKAKKTIRFLLTPYANAQRLKKDLGTQDTDMKAWEILCSEWKKNISHDPDVNNIVVTHSYLLPEKKDMFQDDLPQEDSGERSIVGTLGGISLDNLPSGIDYVIAGHIHKAQELYSTKTKAYYTGSPLIYSLSESGQEKSVLILDIARTNKEYRVPLAQIRDVKEIRFTSFETIGEILEQEKENYIILIWEGDRYFTTEEHQYLRANHSYILRIESCPKISQQDSIVQNIQYIQKQSTKELFVEYFKSKNNNQLPPEDLLQLFDECTNEESTSVVLERKRGFLPKYLKIKGFYSYKNEIKIDFTLLEEKGFFGIFGNTGSGKSAIIEAMIIAVFYRIERIGMFGSRGKGNFSNNYGIMNLDSNELVIDFIFEINGIKGVEEYLCRIRGIRDKKKYFDVKMSREVLIKDQDDWIPVENNSGEEIVGITYDDFRKTIVLQQRDFLGFISSEPKENTETLMRLFQLERFDLYQVIDILEKREKFDLSTLQTKIETLSHCTDIEMDELTNQKHCLEEYSQEFSRELESKRNHVLQLEQQELQFKQSILLKEKFEYLQIQEETFTKAKERNSIKSLIILYENIEKNNKMINELTNELSTLTQSKIQEDELLQERELQGKNYAQELSFKTLELEQNQLSWGELLKDKTSEKVLELEYKKNNYNKIQTLAGELQSKIDLSLENLKIKDKLYQELIDNQQEEKKIRDLLGLATVLEHLKDNCKCPLCGSLDHPHPYENNQEVDLNVISKLVQDLQFQYSKLVQEEVLLRENQQKLIEYQQQLQDMLEKYTSIDELVLEYQKLLAQKISQEEKINILQKESQELKSLCQKLEKDLNNCREEYNTKKLSCQSITDKIQYIQQNIQQCEKELHIAQEEKQKFQAQYNLTDDHYETIKLYPQKTEEEIDNYFREFLTIFGEYNSIRNILDSKISLVDIQDSLKSQQSELEILEQQHREQLQAIGSLDNRIQIMIDGIVQKEKLQKRYAKLSLRKENIELLKKLFKASGFVNFIGQKYLMKLCYTANQRFLRFTQNQFELTIPDENDDKKGRVVVIDRLSGGNKRDMLTLSGGQSFQAALALALALADESGAGHRFFFIDEGFGSLDVDSLYIVLESLKELTELENRVVGLISHVTIMKEEMPAYLQVTLDKSQGTKISLVLE